MLYGGHVPDFGRLLVHTPFSAAIAWCGFASFQKTRTGSPMSSEFAIHVRKLSKCFQVYDTPRDRLKQFLLPRLAHTVGQPARNYFREFWAVHEVSFRVRRGGTLGIIGRNGNGKSTLLQTHQQHAVNLEAMAATREQDVAHLEAAAALPRPTIPASEPVQSDRYACSVVIPTKNGGVQFREALQALQAQTIWAKTELLVVDSGSSDGTVDAARAAGARVVQIPPEDFNHGATRDFGISMARSGIVILLVQDALPFDDRLLESVVQAFDDAEVAGVYARQIPRPGADVLTKRNLDRWLTGRTRREERQMPSLAWYEALPPMEKYLFCNFDNVCSAIRRTVWEAHRFGHIDFGEDIDWAERVLKEGHKLVYEPSAAVVHSHDRPVSYEYKRTYVCHRKLYRQFQLRLVPSLRGVHRSWAYSTLSDLRYIAAQSVAPTEKVKLWVKAPVLNLFSAIAQYRAACDEAAGRDRRVQGV